MSGDPLYVQPDGVRSYAQAHNDVVAGLAELTGAAAPEAAGVQTSHGAIASSVSTALSGVLGTRQETLSATRTSGSTISGLLEKAADLYEQGDQKAAATLKAAAQALQSSQRASAAATDGGATSSAGGGAEMVGQVAQSVTAPLQGAQQLVQQVSQAGEKVSGEGAAPGDSAGTGRAPEPPPVERDQADPRSV